MEVNPEVLKDPTLIHKDPYGRGWLMTVSVPDEENGNRNLLPASVVSAWMRESIEKLKAAQAGQPNVQAGEGMGVGLEPTSKVVHELLLT